MVSIEEDYSEKSDGEEKIDIAGGSRYPGSDAGRRHGKRSKGEVIGGRKRNKNVEEGVVRANCETDEMVDYMRKMVNGVSTIVYCMDNRNTTSTQERANNIRTTVKEEVQEELMCTNASLDDLKTIIMSAIRTEE